MDLQTIVAAQAAELSHLTATQIGLDHSLLWDLRIDEDDFSYVFVPALEKELGIKTSPTDWAGIRTVRDVVEMLLKKVARA